MGDEEIRTALQQHWIASDANDFEAEHDIYRDDAVLDYPQSGERIRGRRRIQESRTVQPNKKRFSVRRIIGNGDLWVTEFVLTYDGSPPIVTITATDRLSTRSAPPSRSRSQSTSATVSPRRTAPELRTIPQTPTQANWPHV